MGENKIVIDTSDKALEILEETIRGREGFVYKSEIREAGIQPMCRYVENGSPSCLIGQVLHARGVSVQNLVVWDQLECDVTIDDIASSLIPDNLVLSEEAREVFAAAQDSQDRGYTWGQALEAARRTAERLKGLQ